MATEELFGAYMFFLSQQADPSTFAVGDSLDLVLDDTDGAETVQYSESDLYARADGIIAVELDAGRKWAEGDFNADGLVLSKEQDSPTDAPITDDLTIEGYTATDDLWL